MKMIEVVGYGSYDIVLYLAQIIKELGESVTVVDETLKTLLYEYLPDVHGLDGHSVTELRGVKFLRSLNLLKDDSDYCIRIRTGGQFLDECSARGLKLYQGSNATEWIFTTSEDAREAGLTEAAFELVRDTVNDNGEGAKAKYLRVIRGGTGVTRELYKGMLASDKDGLIVIPYIERDRKAELYLSVREDVSFRPVSERLSSAIERMVYRLRPGTKVAEFERAYRTVIRGRCAG